MSMKTYHYEYGLSFCASITTLMDYNVIIIIFQGDVEFLGQVLFRTVFFFFLFFRETDTLSRKKKIVRKAVIYAICKGALLHSTW